MKKTTIFSNLDIRSTPLREEIITLFLNNQGIAFSEAEINSMFGQPFDRVTVYRTIKTFLDKLIIHKVICEDGVLRYAMTEQPQNKSHHAHFQCTECGKVSCLKDKGVGRINLPSGYKTNELYMLIKGVCPQCTNTPKTIHENK
jgi:Fur family transcriptional regulator, ferric uptake regulator